MKNLILLIICIFSVKMVFSQYPPAAGLAGSTAIHKDSSIIINWAKSCIVQRGDYDISHSTDSVVTNGTVADALNSADAITVSLGDSGIAILSFFPPISNGSGFDFAIFENSFDGNFLELAFVEVSTDSVHWYRFDAVSLTQKDTQISTFGLLDPTKINNLAGKYKVFYGTPFDLEELDGKPYLDIDSVNFIKVIDVIGSVTPQYASYDWQGHIINDPWPTPFFTGGFDLDAIGVIHQSAQNVPIIGRDYFETVWPNPCEDFMLVEVTGTGRYDLVSISGEVVLSGKYCDDFEIKTSMLNPGLYSLRIYEGNKVAYSKFVKK